MQRNWVSTGVVVALALAILAGCNNQGNQNGNAAPPTANANVQEHVHPDSGKIQIPGYNEDTGRMEGSTVKANNYEGNTSQNAGMSVYSTIGSSGLHEGGISAHLQSRLTGAGIEGIKVLVLDDAVILGREKKEIVSTSYDPMQNKVLNGTSGTSGTGTANMSRPPETLPPGKVGGEQTNGTGGTSGTPGVPASDNLEAARGEIAEMFGNNVRILTVEQKDAVAAIDRIKKEMQATSPSSKKLVKEISLLMKHASDKTK
ncbi:hypothetical protein [Aneurinibacillus migulanus]|uniref:Sporulation lipoprotein, YhcN/YlaJ family n=1 Tax=Aneurinibacillus migulanus TaxID=47500 RepID=A0A1G8YBF5_ANEMI|nr:hypothetical protein [Aneurinibacillus migulanus]MED0895367.1 hypothetical protein [Aneurinibacillus migulanus]MED1618023.1 hypothetical protein [Aneurinibacillus migulanus]GED15133.1 hypothetical protein AMI01nite_31240 [Aneurinibacillus migulanus]SDK00192.1 hypothetical protein SAMN04487909_13546 [Aneurinibacillus migulanus]